MRALLPLLICLALLGCGRKGPSQIRIRNATDRDFHTVVLGSKTFGDIKSGAASDYQEFQIAYAYSSVKLVAGTNRMAIMPLDYVGEKPLGRGRFTYVITIVGPDLDIRAEKDK